MNLKQSLEKHDFHGVWMRLLALAMILIVAVSALIASPVSANGTDTTFAPFEYRENGKMTGIDMELIRAIAQEEGFEVTIQSLGFNAALQALSSNQVDVVIAGMSITDERKATYDFSCKRIRLYRDFRGPVINHVRDGQIRQCGCRVRRLSGACLRCFPKQRFEDRDSEGAAW